MAKIRYLRGAATGGLFLGCKTILQVMREDEAIPRGQELGNSLDSTEGRMLEQNRMLKPATFDEKKISISM